MRYITITTPDNIDIQYRLAGVGSRLAAAIIDGLIQALAFLLVTLPILFGVMGFRFSSAAQFTFGGPALAFIIIAYFVIYFGYFFVFELAMNGQSPGKKVLGLRVIRENGRPVAAAQSMIRNVFRYMIDALGPGAVLILFSRKNKRLGDMLASTVVVAESEAIAPPSWGQAGLASSAEANAAEVNTSEASLLLENLRLTREEREWLKEYLRRKDGFMDGGQNLRRRFIQYFAKKFDVPEDLISEELLEKILRLNQ